MTTIRSLRRLAEACAIILLHVTATVHFIQEPVSAFAGTQLTSVVECNEFNSGNSGSSSSISISSSSVKKNKEKKDHNKNKKNDIVNDNNEGKITSA